MKLKPLATALTTVLLLGCSSGTDWKDWSDFERFKVKDENGERINCDEMISTSMRREMGYTVHLHDYLYETRYEFSQCKAEIAAHVDSYCSTHTADVAEYHLGQTSGWSPSNGFYHFCRGRLVEELAKVDSRYELPTESNHYIVLHDEGAMLKPESITKISFSEEYRDALWVIKLTTNEATHALYFGDKERWEQAKIDFAHATSTSTTPVD